MNSTRAFEGHDSPPPGFLAGVIEGFYGVPWTHSERLELFSWMPRWNLNTYLYAPKDDMRHRACWRELYPDPEADRLGDLIHRCARNGLCFIYALSPGLDIQYSNEAELEALRQRFQQMLNLGCRHFALLFDDIPGQPDPNAIAKWGSLAAAQCHVANEMFRWVGERSSRARFLFCPTAYCGRMAKREVGGSGYLQTIGSKLVKGIDVLWTGPEIISREITTEHAIEVGRLLGRKPLIWDNLHANDYDGRRFFCGPYSGRPAELRGAVAGLLSNPNNEFPLNFVPLRTLGEYVRGKGPWDARAAYLSAMREWQPCFTMVGNQITFEDLVLLGDCYYLPHEEGPEAEALYRQTLAALSNDSLGPAQVAEFRQKATRLQEVCYRLTQLQNRPLFYALSRRLWDLREELDLLLRCLDWKSKNPRPGPCVSDFHLPGTYRGGLVARLQRLLIQKPDGTFTPASTTELSPNAP